MLVCIVILYKCRRSPLSDNNTFSVFDQRRAINQHISYVMIIYEYSLPMVRTYILLYNWNGEDLETGSDFH